MEDEDKESAFLKAALSHQMLAMAEESRIAQWFGENISNHGLRIDVGDRNHAHAALLLLLAHVVVCQRDVLGSGAIDRVVGHSDGALAVAVHVDRLDKLIHVEFRSEVVEPARFFSSFGAVLAVVG